MVFSFKRLAVPLVTVLLTVLCSSPVHSDGAQRPGDMNQDNVVHDDQTDPLNLLEKLFVGTGAFPCDTAAANIIVMDSNGDGWLDQSDAIWMLTYIFLDGDPHYRGEDCIIVPDCPDVCE